MPTFCEPCPGKMTAINDSRSVARLRRASRWRLARAAGADRDGDGADLLLEALDEAAGGESVGHGDRVPHGLGARTAVPDDGDAADPEQRRAAVLGIVDAATEA